MYIVLTINFRVNKITMTKQDYADSRNAGCVPFITPRSAVYVTDMTVVAYGNVGLSTPTFTQKLSAHDKINGEKIILNDVTGPDFIHANNQLLKTPSRYEGVAGNTDN